MWEDSREAVGNSKQLWCFPRHRRGHPGPAGPETPAQPEQGPAGAPQGACEPGLPPGAEREGHSVLGRTLGSQRDLGQAQALEAGGSVAGQAGGRHPVVFQAKPQGNLAQGLEQLPGGLNPVAHRQGLAAHGWGHQVTGASLSTHGQRSRPAASRPRPGLGQRLACTLCRRPGPIFPVSFANQTPDCNPRGRPPRAPGSEGPGWEQQPGPWACGRPRGAQFTGQRGPGEGGPELRREAGRRGPGRSWRQKRALLALERG